MQDHMSTSHLNLACKEYTGPPAMTKLCLRAPEFSNAAIKCTPANSKYFKAKDIKIV